MNKDTVKGNWHQLAGKLKAKWGKLTNNDLKRAEGNKENSSGKLQGRYGLTQEKAETQIKELDHM